MMHYPRCGSSIPFTNFSKYLLVVVVVFVFCVGGWGVRERVVGVLPKTVAIDI